jgi:SAM-dependent methyltransferase
LPPKDAVQSINAKHGFDIMALQKEHHLDMYGVIRMINYARKLFAQEWSTTPVETMVGNITAQLASQGSDLYIDEAYLLPSMEDDQLLFALDFDDSDDEDGLPASQASVEEQLRAQIGALQEALAVSQNLARNLLQQEPARRAAAPISKNRKDPNSVYWQGGATRGRRPLETESPEAAFDDDYYFKAYSDYNIHQEMLNDRVRTESYRDAILKNAALFKGKVVLDVGCGTAILSMFAARAGAARVIGIDNSDMADTAKQIVEANNLQNVVTIVKARLEDIESLPHNIEKVSPLSPSSPSLLPPPTPSPLSLSPLPSPLPRVCYSLYSFLSFLLLFLLPFHFRHFLPSLPSVRPSFLPSRPSFRHFLLSFFPSLLSSLRFRPFHHVIKVDIIISEWMGYCLFFESMHESVLVAKKRFPYFIALPSSLSSFFPSLLPSFHPFLFFLHLLSLPSEKKRWLVEGGLILPDANTLTIEAADDSRLRPSCSFPL